MTQGVDLLEDIVGCVHTFRCGSQQSLTQEEDEEYVSLTDACKGLHRRDVKYTLQMHKADEELGEFIKVLFRGSPPGERDGLKNRMAVYSEIFRIAGGGYMVKRSTVFNFLLTESYNLPASVLPHLVEMTLESINMESPSAARVCDTSSDDAWSPFEFLPSFLMRTVDIPKGDLDPEKKCRHDMSIFDGRTYGRYIIDEICKLPWPVGSVNMIISTFRELLQYFPPDVTMNVVDKAIVQVESIPYKEVPKLGNNILLLLTNAVGLKSDQQLASIDRFIRMIENLDARYVDTENTQMEGEDGDEQQLLDSQGALINHFCMVISKDLPLGRAFVKACGLERGGANNLSEFRLALLLSLGRIKRLEARVFEVVFARISFVCEISSRTSESPWITRWWEPQAGVGNDYNTAATNSDIARRCLGRNAVFERVASKSNRGGWDAVVQSFSRVAMMILDKSGSYMRSQGCFRDVRNPKDPNQAEETRTLTAMDANEIASFIAIRTLVEGFENNSIVRRDVLEFIRVHIISTAGEPRNSGIMQIVRLLAALVDKVPNLLLRETNSLREILETVCKLPPRPAYGLLQALRPLLELRPDLVDFCLITFRKALFQRDTEPRLVSLCGLLLLLGTFPSQTREEQQMDIVNTLYRCFSCQQQVRIALYTGVAQIYQQVDHSVKVALSSLILTHLNSMLLHPISEDASGTGTRETGEEFVFPLLVEEKCIERTTGEIIDPVNVLLQTFVKCESKASPQVISMINSFAAYEGELEEFLQLSKGKQGLLLIIHIYEVLLWCKFDQNLWSNLQKWLHLYNSVGNTQNVASTPKKQKTGSSEITEGAKKSRPLPKSFQSSLSVEQLLEMLGDKSLPGPFREYLYAVLRLRLSALREVKRPSPSDALALCRGMHNRICVDMAIVSSGAVLPTSYEVAVTVGSHLAQMLLSQSETELSIDIYLGFHECVLVATETNMVSEFLANTLVKMYIDNIQDVEDSTSNRDSPADRGFSILTEEICGGLLNVSSSAKVKWAFVTAVVETMSLILPSCSQHENHAEWIREFLVFQPSYCNPKYVAAVMQLHLMAEQLSTDGKHHLSKCLGFPQAMLKLFGKRTRMDYANTGEEDSSGDEIQDEGNENNQTQATSKSAGSAGSVEQCLSNSVLTEKTAPLVFSAILQCLNETLDHCEWVASVMRTDTVFSPGDPLWSFNSELVQKAAKARHKQESILYRKLSEVILMCSPLVRTRFDSLKQTEPLAKAITRVFKLVQTQLKQCCVLKRRTVSATQVRLLRSVKKVAEKVNILVDNMTNSQQKHGSPKIVPDLVFQIEQYDVQLLKLHKVATQATENISQYACKTAYRDFRILKKPKQDAE